MGDSTCLLHGFSYASAIPNQSKQGNSMHQLGESISFGRFINDESLSWDKWSSFPHKKYVEEAERYAQPGSVAEKKAFFEAHYKRIAAQKAAALLLLEQENAAKIEAEAEIEIDDNAAAAADDDDDHHHQRLIFDSHTQLDVLETEENIEVETSKEEENAVITEKIISDNSFDNLENKETVSVSEGSSGTSQMEKPLLKQNSDDSEDVTSVTSKKLTGISSLKSSIRRKTWKVPSTPAKQITPHFKKENNLTQSTRKSNVESMEIKRPSPKSFRRLINLIPNKDPDKEPVFASKNSVLETPMRTPILGAINKGVSKYPAATPRSENRMKTPIAAPTGNGSKTAGPKWHVLSSVYSKSLTACRNKLQSPTTLSTPFILRTEERAAKRKQKLEEKFNADEVQKKAQTQQQKTLKEKAGNEIRKLSYSFCFKARPLPDFYKEREAASINHVNKKTPTVKSQTAVLGRSISNKKEGTVSMPPPPPPPVKNNNNNNNNNPPKKNLLPKSSLPKRITRENKSPNIQH